jgi:hypothetical protein
MTAYRCEFEDGVGRRRDVRPLELTASDADDLAEQVHGAVERFLVSRLVEVHVDLEEGKGWVYAGLGW